MRRTVYFALDAIWSIVLATIIWYFFLINASFDFYHNSDDTIAGIVLFAGAALYLICTVAYIIVGAKKVKNWHWWMAVVAVIIGAAMGFAGTVTAVYGSELIGPTIFQSIQ